jgi:two-component system response regulator NreC
MDKIRVLIADDHAVLRSGLRMLINTQPDMDVVGEVADGQEALKKSRELRPDIVLMDITMPGGNGLKAIEGLRMECPKTRVLILTMHDDEAYLRAALAAGGSGYVVKKAADTELLSAIRAVHGGHTFVDLMPGGESPELAVQGISNRPHSEKSRGLLSQREREVLTLVAVGYTHQQIAERLNLSIKTVETYRSRLAEKLNLRTRADLVRYAIELGLLDAEQSPPRESFS